MLRNTPHGQQIVEITIEQMAQEFPFVKQQVTEIKSDVTRITNALLGDGKFEKTGLVDTVKDQQVEINNLKEALKKVDEKHENRFNAIKWLVVGLSLASGFGIAKALELISSL